MWQEGLVKLISGCSSEGVQSRVKQQKPCVDLNIVPVNLVELPQLLMVLDGIVVKFILYEGGGVFRSVFYL